MQRSTPEALPPAEHGGQLMAVRPGPIAGTAAPLVNRWDRCKVASLPAVQWLMPIPTGRRGAG
jgi:hypothetical protein